MDKHHYRNPNVAVAWLVLLIFNREFPASNLFPKTGCPQDLHLYSDPAVLLKLCYGLTLVPIYCLVILVRVEAIYLGRAAGMKLITSLSAL